MNVSEIFYSIQGEGPYVGTPSVFLRLAGCNLRCHWCDTTYALERNEAITLDPQTILELFAEGGWITRLDYKGHAHLVITGGEPMLQQDAIVKMFQHFENFVDQKKVPFKPKTSIETNGTVDITRTELIDYIETAIISPKLRNSGLAKVVRYKPEILQSYIDSFDKTVFKFVVFSKDDMKEIILNYRVKLRLLSSQVWLMPAGATVEEYRKNATAVAELCKEYGFKYSPRLHLDLWKGVKGT